MPRDLHSPLTIRREAHTHRTEDASWQSSIEWHRDETRKIEVPLTGGHYTQDWGTQWPVGNQSSDLQHAGWWQFTLSVRFLFNPLYRFRSPIILFMFFLFLRFFLFTHSFPFAIRIQCDAFSMIPNLNHSTALTISLRWTNRIAASRTLEQLLNGELGDISLHVQVWWGRYNE